MVEQVRGRLDYGTPASSVPPAGQEQGGSRDFAPYLHSQIESPAGQGHVPPAGSTLDLTPQPARVNIAQALHFLLIQSRPHPALQFAPSQVFRPLETMAAGSHMRSNPMPMESYPRPPADNGRGLHWIPTTSQSQEVVDQFMASVESMGIRWVTFLNNPDDLTGNEYLVRRLTQAGVMPIMRIYTDSGAPLEEEITGLVKHFRRLGVHYVQLYNEPNLRCENGGREPDVNRYLDDWIPAAEQVLRAGALPGIGALSPQGDVDDLPFLTGIMDGLKARGKLHLLDRSWLSVHNYGADHLRVREYDRIIRQSLGRSLPQIGTEAGIYPDGHITEEDQIRIVSEAYAHMRRRESYYFAYSLWTVANMAGGGHDGRWEHQALYRLDGPSPLAQALEQKFARA